MTPTEPEPVLVIIFGATGDLSRRMLLPAFRRLAAQRKFSQRSHILGIGRRPMGDQAFRDSVGKGSEEDSRDVPWFNRNLHYRQAAESNASHFQILAKQIEDLEQECDLPGNRVYYLALPLEAFGPTVTAIGKSGLHLSKGWTRIVVEKPFGHDQNSARDLNKLLHQYFNEPQIFRIDHFLGKETVQNLLVLRFANPIFETLWNRDRVESVQITVSETLGVEKRAAFYETAGALRDMVQNHLTQLLSLIAMEIPGSLDPEAIRDEKVKVLRSTHPIEATDVVFGQYQEGRIEGKAVPGYRQESGIDSNSTTETYVALKLKIDNWRWQGVPFYLRVGKRMAKKLSQIVIQFRCAPVMMFHPFASCQLHSNSLTITLQPDEGFDLCFEVKKPGQETNTQSQPLRFRYADAFAPLPAAYETLLVDILQGEQVLFVRSDWVERSWQLYDPILRTPPPLHFYKAGSWGPEAATDLVASEHDVWLPS